ncbi:MULTISPECIES: hypothetical protein [unclassified Candidatus Frackibacter]|uniref:hypothetical protein n=1 Tax=unclassified Candidatus Frackibacter TaxID=2648818 RepID=UPI0008876EFA|nr:MULTISPECIES: hypothetical protein [unclassified Candidatus Frackibacter]SDC38256.1 hypothetical protein SAMN04515661_10876 [Candidatus Frackibacter sp. WG11]SEM62005.1 hypothetical protein SAMN04488698_10913 [Candidatus Frackibacter sp. WG12]SFL65919.1 hypothetical protein SAMN04488699_10876 [Candidatus Frackibacter sp. WG13]
MLIDRLIKEVTIELQEAHKLLDELNRDTEDVCSDQLGFSNEELLLETTREIIDEQKCLLSNLKTDQLATVISKIEEKYTACPSCDTNLSESCRIVRLPHQSLIYIKENPVPPTEIVIVDTCPHCNYILNFEFFKGQKAHKLYQILIDDLSDTEFELEEGVKI